MSLNGADKSGTKRFYIYNSIAFEIENANKYTVLDMFVFDENDEEMIIRLYNFNISFLLMKLPNMSINDFRLWCKKEIGSNPCTIYYRNDLKENSCFLFDEEIWYAEISSNSVDILRKTYNKLLRSVRSYYKQLDIDKLSPYDRIIYDNTEDPFRYTKYSLNIKSIKYFLSTRYDIPCVGGISIDSDLLKKGLMFDNETPKLMRKLKSYSINCDKSNIFGKKVIHDKEFNKTGNLTIMSYDIETYNQRTDLPEKDKVIMCIGVSLFHIDNQLPIWKKCLSIRDFTEKDKETINNRIIEQESNDRIIKYTIANEMTSTNDADLTTYVVYKNEKDMLLGFIKLIQTTHPNFICGFNNYNFDDPYIEKRLKLYNISNIMLYLMSNYDITNKQNIPIKTEFKKFPLKIDGELYPDNWTYYGDSIIFLDVYKILLASNSKLYTQEGKGKLKNMLRYNQVKNPYDNSELDKYELEYVDMFRKWDNHIDTYEILHYCLYDAITCGILLIKTSQLIDKIEMSNLTCTAIDDSIYRAVTTRILSIIDRYGYNYGFALNDSPVNKR